MMEKDKLWYLKKFNLFDTINNDEMESLSDMVAEIKSKKRAPYFLKATAVRIFTF